VDTNIGVVDLGVPFIKVNAMKKGIVTRQKLGLDNASALVSVCKVIHDDWSLRTVMRFQVKDVGQGCL
jgi:hypothetical protein